LYARKILERLEINKAKPLPMPMTNHELGSFDREMDRELRALYLTPLGALLFCVKRARSDLEYVVNFVAQFFCNSCSLRWNVVERVFCYLVGTVDPGIHFEWKGHEPFLLSCSAIDLPGISGYFFT
jgi:hypothetical protein